MLEHERALKILRTVEAAGQAEVAAQVRAGGAEQIEYASLGFRLRHHKRLLYHWRTKELVRFRLRNLTFRGTTYVPFSVVNFRGLLSRVAPAVRERTNRPDSKDSVESSQTGNRLGSFFLADSSVSPAADPSGRPCELEPPGVPAARGKAVSFVAGRHRAGA